MKNLDDLDLHEREKQALLELKKTLMNRFSVSECMLFGSKARGDSDKESDMDLLVILNTEVDDHIR